MILGCYVPVVNKVYDAVTENGSDFLELYFFS